MKWVRLAVLLLTLGCASATEPDPNAEPDLGGMPLSEVDVVGDMELTARTELIEGELQVIVTVRNTGIAPGKVAFGGCAFAVRGDGPDGQYFDNRLPAGAICLGSGVLVQLASGGTRQLVVFSDAAATVQQHVRAGTYAMSVYYRPRAVTTLRKLNAGTVSL